MSLDEFWRRFLIPSVTRTAVFDHQRGPQPRPERQQNNLVQQIYAYHIIHYGS